MTGYKLLRTLVLVGRLALEIAQRCSSGQLGSRREVLFITFYLSS